jgi:hypothetical protein
MFERLVVHDFGLKKSSEMPISNVRLMRGLTGKVVLELFGGGVAMAGATIAAISTNSEKSMIGIYVGVGCIFLGWAAFTISQIEEDEK